MDKDKEYQQDLEKEKYDEEGGQSEPGNNRKTGAPGTGTLPNNPAENAERQPPEDDKDS